MILWFSTPHSAAGANSFLGQAAGGIRGSLEQGRVLPARSIPLLQLGSRERAGRKATRDNPGDGIGGDWGWYVGLQVGVTIRPSGRNQGQAQLRVARQPGPGPRTMARHRPGCNMERLLLQQGQALLPQPKSGSVGRGLSGQCWALGCAAWISCSYFSSTNSSLIWSIAELKWYTDCYQST